MIESPAIVIPVYRRLGHLQELLSSLEKADYGDKQIPLVFKTHQGVSNEVLSFCKAYKWTHGNKTVIKDEEQLQLDENLRRCADLSEQFGSVIILEDDSYVSPRYYQYALAVLALPSDDRIAQFSLYRYGFNAISGLPHEIPDDEYDAFFIQKTSTRGQLFTWQQWKAFREWLQDMPGPDKRLPEYIHSFGLNNWELQHNWFLIEQDKYVLSPKLSVVSNQGPSGVHHTSNIDSGYFQAALQIHPRSWRLPSFQQSQLKYDAYFEIEPAFFTALNEYDFVTDLNGHKPVEILGNAHTLTSKTASKSLIGYSMGLKPLEINILWENHGNDIRLCATRDLVKDVKSRRLWNARQYFAHVPDVGVVNFLRHKWLKYVERRKGSK